MRHSVDRTLLFLYVYSHFGIVVAEARTSGKARLTQHLVTKARPFAFILDHNDDLGTGFNFESLILLDSRLDEARSFMGFASILVLHSGRVYPF